MRRSKRQKALSIQSSTPSIETSPRCSSALEDWDADDEGFMSSGDFLPSRPLSVAVPGGPYCPRRPTLQEVLSDSAPPPWTLSAFMAYLSQNHCLETLEFTMDASRYRKHFSTIYKARPSTERDGTEYVRMLWQKLLDAYIVPNGPREVNLPADVRDRLLSLPNKTAPPDPSLLDSAVKIIYELMDESVLVPFLNSISIARGPMMASPWTSLDDMPDIVFHGSPSARSPLQKGDEVSMNGKLSVESDSRPRASRSPRLSPQSGLTPAISRSRNRLSAYLSHSSGHTSSDTQDGTLTDDSASSPGHSGLEPMTPPTTPPTSDLSGSLSPGTSPRNAREGNGWKKMGAKLGWKKPKASNVSTSTSRRHISRETSETDISL